MSEPMKKNVCQCKPNRAGHVDKLCAYHHKILGGMPGTPVPAKSGSQPAGPTTLEDILSGIFKSAADKHGTNGTLVTVPNLRVLVVKGEADGDWHVAVTDVQVPVFVSEITPAEQAAGVKAPAAGDVITETGFVFWDPAHVNEAWHGNTGWEIHPVTAWTSSRP